MTDCTTTLLPPLGPIADVQHEGFHHHDEVATHRLSQMVGSCDASLANIGTPNEHETLPPENDA